LSSRSFHNHTPPSSHFFQPLLPIPPHLRRARRDQAWRWPPPCPVRRLSVTRHRRRHQAVRHDHASLCFCHIRRRYLLTALAFSSARYCSDPPRAKSIRGDLRPSACSHALPLSCSVTASVQRVFARELVRSSRDLAADHPAADHPAAPPVERKRESSSSSSAASASSRVAASRVAAASKTVAVAPFDDPSLSIIGDSQPPAFDM
jgi:hypothetical protein